MIPTAERMRHLSTHFFARLGTRLAELRAAGVDVIRLDEGSPDLPPPPNVIEGLARAAARADRHGYQPHRGPAALRQAWIETYRKVWEVELDPDSEILPLLGSKEGIFHLSLAYIQPGDIALVPNPGYVTYERGPLFAGGELHQMPLTLGKGYLPELEAIPPEVLQRARLLWLNYPNNPTSAVAPLSFFEQVVDFARRHRLLVCHDAAYSRVTFNGSAAPSVLRIPGAREVAVEFNTLSKSHNMAGWRSAAVLGNRDVVRTLFTLKTNADSSHFLPVFEASVAALETDQGWIDERNQVYRQRRDAVVRGLRALGMPAQTPQAAMYVWSPAPQGWNCVDFAERALEKAHVSFTPGSVFGSQGEGYLRFALTASLERIEQAMERLQKWMEASS
jgi:LL-diaminopimelate aminotransferase